MEVVLVVWKVAIISCVALDKVQLIDEQKYMEEEGSSALYSLLDKHATFKKKKLPLHHLALLLITPLVPSRR